MKLTFLFSFLIFSVVWAESYSQTRLSLDLKNVPVKKFIQEIEDLTDFFFLYQDEVVEKGQRVTIKVNNEPLETILKLFEEQTSVVTEVTENQIVLKRSIVKSIPKAMQQGRQINGFVSDQSGSPLPGVTVIVKGTTTGTVTNANGEFSLTIPADAEILQFSFVGMKTQEIPVEGRTTFTVVMEEAIIGIEEVIAVGYGTMRKSDLTGAVHRAQIQNFEEAPVTNILDALSGSIPGMEIGKAYTAGDEPFIQIRGQSTLHGSTNPLIVLDGMIYRGRIGDINSKDIESVDILKDASSKAVYGAQAANGVIIITTKRGELSKPLFNFSSYYTHRTPARKMRPQNREEFIQAAYDWSWEQAYLPPDYTEPNPDFNVLDWVAWNDRTIEGYNDGTDYDWMGEQTSPGHIFNADLRVSGGSKDFTYMTSIGFSDQEGYILNDTYRRLTGRINLKYDITDWFSLGLNTFGTTTDFSGDFPTQSAIMAQPPLVTPWVDGKLDPHPNGWSTLNPFMASESYDKDIRNQLMGKFFVEISIPWIKGLGYTLNASGDYSWNHHLYASEYALDQMGHGYGQASFNSASILDNILTYRRTFGKDHNVYATLLAGIEKRENESFGADGRGFDDVKLGYYALGNAEIQTITSGGWKEQFLYQMARLNYNYKNKYFFTGTIRKDGYSGFARYNKIGYFPSAGIGWMISEEAPLARLPVLDHLKLRVSYGVNGNTPGRYSSIARVSKDPRYVFNGKTIFGQHAVSLPNYELSWEKTSSLNFGFDFGIFENNISGSLDYYTSTTTDLLWDLSIPEVTGFSSIISNLGKIANHGIEISLFAKIIQASDFSWSIGGNFDKNVNEIKELIGLDLDEDGKEDDLIASNLFIGEPIRAIYGYEIERLWQIEDIGDIYEGWRPGTYKYVDLDPDGEITPNDRQILGYEEPAYSFGIQNNLSYKNFKLKFFIKSIQGGKDGYRKLNMVSTHKGDVMTPNNWYAGYDRWTPSNPDAKFQRVGGDAPMRSEHGYYLQRNFIRLQDISLSYNLSRGLLQSIGINDIMIYISGRDLITITDWPGWDPETGQGLSGRYPVMKGVSLGLDIKF